MGRSRVHVAAGVLLAALVCLPGTATTYAAFTDAPGVQSASLSARTLAPPTAVTCTNDASGGNGFVDIGWTTTSAPAQHRVEAESTPGVWIALGTVATGARTMRITAAMVTSVLSLGATYRIRLVAVSGAWTSPTSTSMVTIQTISLLGLGLGVACVAGAPS
jgi:hypothetical protein